MTTLSASLSPSPKLTAGRLLLGLVDSLLILATILFLASGLLYLCLGYYPVTHDDFWFVFDRHLHLSWFETAIPKYNSHSAFFPSIFFWQPDLRFFHASQEPLLYTGLFLLFLTAILLLVPVWKDESASFTTKLIATLLVTVGSFWMGRASITASGGFNSNGCLVTASAALALLWLPSMTKEYPRCWLATVLVIFSGIIASFSFGAGLSLWPTLFLMAWCLRLPARSLCTLAGAGLVVAVTFALLPSRGGEIQLAASGWRPGWLFVWLCELLGSPLAHAVGAWYPAKLANEIVESSPLPFWCGIVGLLLAVGSISISLLRRDLRASKSGTIGLGLMLFNLGAIALVAIGRADHILLIHDEVVAPRYLFWSILFWVGLLIFITTWTHKWIVWRWACILVALLTPVLFYPSHYRQGLHYRYVQRLSEAAATSLINGVQDEQRIKILSPFPELVYRVASEFRTRHLDMFAQGYQDWIGSKTASSFQEKPIDDGLIGNCRILYLTKTNQGAPAACISGWAQDRKKKIPKTLVILDPYNTARGIARSFSISSTLNRILYSNVFPSTQFIGYIRDYDPQMVYTVHAVSGSSLSKESIKVRTADRASRPQSRRTPSTPARQDQLPRNGSIQKYHGNVNGAGVAHVANLSSRGG